MDQPEGAGPERWHDRHTFFLYWFPDKSPEAVRELTLFFNYMARVPHVQSKLVPCIAWGCYCVREFGAEFVMIDDIFDVLDIGLLQRKRCWRSEVSGARHGRLRKHMKAAAKQAFEEDLIDSVELKVEREFFADIELGEKGWALVGQLRRTEMRRRQKKAKKGNLKSINQRHDGPVETAVSVRAFVEQKGHNGKEATRVAKSFEKWMRRRGALPQPAVLGHPAGGGRKAQAHRYPTAVLGTCWAQYTQTVPKR